MEETWYERSYARGRAMHFSLAVIFYGMALYCLLHLSFGWAIFLGIQGWFHQKANTCKRGFAPVISYATTSWTFGFAAWTAFINSDHTVIMEAFIVMPLLLMSLLALVQTWVSSIFVDLKGDTFMQALKKFGRNQWKRLFVI